MPQNQFLPLTLSSPQPQHKNRSGGHLEVFNSISKIFTVGEVGNDARRLNKDYNTITLLLVFPLFFIKSITKIYLLFKFLL